ncbi:MAG: chemotaxis protein CheW [Gammaproteobacteria bacterium]|nr:chemotaxis protein CheW [Gammaproteobacteria bacterium]MBT8150507.1 chemotaxis protein CheW [Gammaproteobacteria bacterium]NND38278.1 purine-binding chemotaxis protein CheW [Pseudomonadales bacterium]NNL10730.1 purine-binding chemotaxis protein CheW [Pseudomonadales bacterium]RZV55092.1 MAG: purine-binding chemotaxis protein CheW [Pseudomonadales bacterium]
MKYEGNPALLLRQLADKSREVSEQRATKQDLTNAWSGVGFSLCGETVVAPMGEVVEIITVPRYTLVPAVKPWMLGIANVRGRLLPIVDTEAFFGNKLAGHKSNYRVLIVETSHIYVGLVVSKVYGLQHLDEASLKTLGKSADLPFAGFADAYSEQEDGTWYRVSPSRLVTDSDFSDAAIVSHHIATSHKGEVA